MGYSKELTNGNLLNAMNGIRGLLQDLNGLWNAGVLNVGVGWEKQYFDSRCRSAIMAGSTTVV